MFRCDWCENYRDKSECCENPLDRDYGNICEGCLDDHESDIKKLESGVGYMEDRLSKKDEMENKEEPAKKRLPTGVHIISRNEDGSLREDDPLYGKL